MATKIKLCKCGSRNCPELSEQTDGTYSLTDDFGGSVRLTKEQLMILKGVAL